MSISLPRKYQPYILLCTSAKSIQTGVVGGNVLHVLLLSNPRCPSSINLHGSRGGMFPSSYYRLQAYILAEINTAPKGIISYSASALPLKRKGGFCRWASQCEHAFKGATLTWGWDRQLCWGTLSAGLLLPFPAALWDPLNLETAPSVPSSSPFPLSLQKMNFTESILGPLSLSCRFFHKSVP